MSNQGITVFRTAPYGAQAIAGEIRIVHRDEVRIIGSAFRVVQVTMRVRSTEEQQVVWEYVAPTEYDSLVRAVVAALRVRRDLEKTQAVETARAAEGMPETRRVSA